MGRWFAARLKEEGRQVVITGRNQSKLRRVGRELGVATAANVAAVRGADAVLLSVPIESFEQVAAEIGPHLREGQVVVDITSIKVMPVAAMRRYFPAGTALGAHALFGPGARSLVNQNFILTPTDAAEKALAAKVRRCLEDRGARVSLMSPGKHDEMMTVILGLAHYIALVSADALLSLGGLEEMAGAGGITFKVLLTLVESVVSEDPELYASLQMNLPGLARVEGLFQEKAGLWAKIVAEGDRARLIRRMRTLRREMKKATADFGQAYENMYRLVEWR